MLNRNLKATPTPIVLFYHAILGFIMIWIYISIEAAIAGELRLAEYSLKLWSLSYAAATPHTVGTAFVTLAFQKDKSGMVALMSNI